MGSEDDVQRRDVFISHASEDKEAIARPLAAQLRQDGFTVWFDEYELVLGDSLRAKIEAGVSHSQVGVVILSHSFFAKSWSRWELSGLTARHIAGEQNVILPIWHELELDDVRSYSAPLADLVAVRSGDGVPAVADAVGRVVRTRAAGAEREDALDVVDGATRARPRRRRAAAIGALAIAVVTAVLVAINPFNSGGSGLALKPGPEGCVSWDGTGGACATARGMDGPHAIAVSPDGRNAYVAAHDSSSLVAFDRDPGSGSLEPQTGADGCFARDGARYFCADLQPLGGAEAVAVSRDGRSVYVASARSSALVMLDRDVDSGALTPRPGRTGCFARDAGACAPARALANADGVAVSRDDRNVYVAAYDGDAVAIFDRDPRSGSLEQKAGRAGCVAARDGGSCAEAKLLTGPEAVTVSRDGKNVYVATDRSNAVMVFDRDLRSGALRLKRGQDACVSEDGTNGDCAIAPEVGVGDSPDSVAVSPDGRNVYVASDGDGGVAILDRDSHGALKAKPGVEGCISRSGNGGRCARSKALLEGRGVVTVSPDGTSVYVASYEPGGLTVFDRDDRGALRLRLGHEGCISEKGSGGRCAKAPTLGGAAGIAASPDGRNVYVASFDKGAVTVLDRLEATR
jgi:DNA-binding beta-propeller fold protein YncE